MKFTFLAAVTAIMATAGAMDIKPLPSEVDLKHHESFLIEWKNSGNERNPFCIDLITYKNNCLEAVTLKSDVSPDDEKATITRHDVLDRKLTGYGCETKERDLRSDSDFQIFFSPCDQVQPSGARGVASGKFKLTLP